MGAAALGISQSVGEQRPRITEFFMYVPAEPGWHCQLEVAAGTLCPRPPIPPNSWSWHYQGAGDFAECIAFGRIAGEHAAAEKPWS